MAENNKVWVYFYGLDVESVGFRDKIISANRKEEVDLRKKSSGAVWGVMLILFGIIIGGKVLHWFDFNIFFRGWWSLFLIIPYSVRFLTERGRRMEALKGLFIGVLLLMAAQGFIEFGMLFPLIIAGFLVMSGLKMLMPKEYFDKKNAGEKQQKTKNTHKKEQAAKKRVYNQDESYAGAADYYSEEYNYYDSMLREETTSKYHFTAEEEAEFGEFGQKFGWNNYANRGEYRRSNPAGSNSNQRSGRQCTCTAILCGKEIHFSKEVFDGATITALLGVVELNLRDAVFYHDTVIEAVAVMGGIDIFVPKNVHVVVSSTPFLGGIDSHIKRNKPVPPDAVTIYINAKSIMGGIEIK